MIDDGLDGHAPGPVAGIDIGGTKIATLIGADVETMAQVKPGDRIRFRQVSFEEGRERLIKQRQSLAEVLRILD